MACDDFRPDHNGECLNCDEGPEDHHMDAKTLTVQEYDDLIGLLADIKDDGWAPIIAKLRAQHLDAAAQQYDVTARTHEPTRDWRKIRDFYSGNTDGQISDLSREMMLFDIGVLCAIIEEILTHRGETPALYEAAKQACHKVGFPWTDPRTGEVHPAPSARNDVQKLQDRQQDDGDPQRRAANRRGNRQQKGQQRQK